MFSERQQSTAVSLLHPLTANRFMFTGREYTSTFGVYEYRARAYHPGLGRFTGEDPKGFDAGDYNLFRYCHNDPEDITDPMGLDTEEIDRLIKPLPPMATPFGLFEKVHRFVATTNKDGSIKHTYGWGENAFNGNWATGRDTPEDIAAAKMALKYHLSRHIGGSKFDSYIERAYESMKDERSHLNLGICMNCQDEAARLIGRAQQLEMKDDIKKIWDSLGRLQSGGGWGSFSHTNVAPARIGNFNGMTPIGNGYFTNH